MLADNNRRNIDTEKILWIRSALYFMVVAGFLGVLLRFAFVIEMPEWFGYKNVQHAHSHVAMTGWLSAAFYIGICHFFELTRPFYKKIFWYSQVAVLGMLISFPLQGYGLFSILFSIIYMVMGYVFIWVIWRELSLRQRESESRNSLSVRFLKASLFFLALSTLGIWAIGPIVTSAMKGTALYYASVQFFLHFQFNGWFIFVLLALTFRVFEREQIGFNQRAAHRFFWLLFTSCFYTYALAITWSTPEDFIFWLNSFGVLLQAVALYYFLKILSSISEESQKTFSRWLFIIWGIAFFCLSFKILIQTFVAIPYLATISYTIRNFVIGFIHLLMLGALSTFLFGLFRYSGVLIKKSGVHVFLLGVFMTEFILFGQGLLLWAEMGFIPQYHLIIALASLVILIGMGMISWKVKIVEKVI